MDWFERLTGFAESGYASTQQRLTLEGGLLRSTVNGAAWSVGTLELVSLRALRERALAAGGLPGRATLGIMSGDVRRLHQAPALRGALFQVASQFNLLEMTGPNVSPEDGVTRYQSDPTQGPACAMAAGAATLYRNYFVPVGGAQGQTRTRQLDGLEDLGPLLAQAVGLPVSSLWEMRNGYALGHPAGLDAVARHLAGLDAAGLRALEDSLKIGVHWDVDVTDAPQGSGQQVSQAFCSAMPVSYANTPERPWAPLASLVLRAAYQATIWAAVLNAQRGASNVVLLTRLGGGAFGNETAWIDAALRQALGLAAGMALDVRIVSYGPASPSLRALVAAFQGAGPG